MTNHINFEFLGYKKVREEGSKIHYESTDSITYFTDNSPEKNRETDMSHKDAHKKSRRRRQINSKRRRARRARKRRERG